MFSSQVLYTGDGFESTAFRCGAVYHPFRPPEDGQELESVERAPMLCLKCAGFLNPYCQVDAQSGEWQCSLCTYINPPFLAQSTSEDLAAFVELEKTQVEFIERDLTPIYTPVGVEEHIHLFSIDTFVSGAEDIEAFLRSSFECLSANTRVCVIGFGKSVNLLRLCGGGESDTAIIADTLPGVRDCAHTLRHFFQQGEYTTPAGKALLIVKDIAVALKCMAVGRLDNKTVTTTTCAVLVQVARELGAVHGPGVRMLLVTARTIPLGVLPAHMTGKGGIGASISGLGMDALLEGVGGATIHDSGRIGSSSGVGSENSGNASLSRIEGFAALGYDACVFGRCWIDVLVIGLHAVQLDLLDALAFSSGGSVVSGYSLSEEVVLASVERCLRLPTRCFPPHVATLTNHQSHSKRLHTDGTIFFEVRMSRGVMPETIFGPVIMQNQAESTANLVSGLRGSIEGSSLSCCVDRQHVTNMVNITAASAAEGAGAGRDDNRAPDVVYKELCRACNSSEYIASCALMRADPDFTLSFLLQPNEDLAAADGVVVQLVLRWCDVTSPRQSDNSINSNNRGGGGQSCQRTRILTFKLRQTADKKEFLSAVDVDLWTSMAARAITGDLHAASDGLGLSKASNVTDKQDPLAGLLSSSDEVNITEEVDEVVREIITHFKDENAEGVIKVHQMVRLLYHLREGPLLNGPCVNAQESYILRSVFLSFSPDHFLTLVQGSLQLLDVSSLPEGVHRDELSMESWIITSAINASPDSMNLLPDRIAVIDLGNFILMRAGIDVDDAVFLTLCPALERVIRRRIAGRHPYPALFAFHAGSPQERMAFARLNPSHTDTHERVRQTLPLLTAMSGPELDDHISYLPYTDQRSYVRYLFHMAPNFTRNLLSLLASQEAGEDYLSERGRVFPTVAAEGMDRGDNEHYQNYAPPPPPLSLPSSSLYPPPPVAPVSSHLPTAANSTESTRTFPPPPVIGTSTTKAGHKDTNDSSPLTLKFPPPPPQPTTAPITNVTHPPPPSSSSYSNQ